LKNHKELHPVVLTAEMHVRSVTIHPSINGNERISRLVMNMILFKNGYVIANIKGDDTNRMRYYNSLESVHLSISKDAFIALVTQVEIECLERNLEVLS
jgi:Fic family protein